MIDQLVSPPILLIVRRADERQPVPDDYEEMLAFYTQHGYRVIALAGKSMPGLTWIKAQRLKRFVSRSSSLRTC